MKFKHPLLLLLLCLVSIACPVSSRAAGWLWNMPPNTVWLDSGKRNNVFYTGDTISFRPTASGAATYEVRDYWGNVVDQGSVGSIITPKVTQPGWYKIYLYGTTSQSPWGTSVGGAMFTIMRRNANFPALPAQNVSGGADPLLDLVMRGAAAIGPERHSVVDVNDPAGAIAKIDAEIALDKQWYANTDSVRPRPLMIAFPNGTQQNLNGVKQIVAHFMNDVKYWEPRNEPNDISGDQFAVNEMKPFYDAVKSVDPTAKVMGPGVVSISLLPWIEQFLSAGGGKSIDAFSFHCYGNTNGDVWLARKSLDALNTLLAKYGVQNVEKWQTEQGYFAASYGVYQPRLQGRWTMVQMMAYEQYGIPKEHNNFWYDRCGGFWDFPAWWSNEDGSLNPGGTLMRVWSEELYGKKFVKSFDFGTPGNQLYIGSQFAGSGKQVYALMSTGATDGRVELNVSGATSVHVVSAFGVEQDVAVVNGKVTLPVPELPVYVETTAAVTVTPINYGTNLALTSGVKVTADSVVGAPPSGSPDPALLVNGFLESSYFGPNDVWRHNTTAFPAWIDIQFPAPTTMDRVLVYAGVPWSLRGSMLDYDLQYQNTSGQWVTLQTVKEPTKTFQAYTPINRTNVDSYYSDRWIFQHSFTPITTQKLRVYVRDVTWGGDATEEAINTGGQGGPHQITLREIEVYNTGSVTTPAPAPTPLPVVTGSGTGLLGDYFSGQDLSARVLSRTDATLNFDWGTGSPATTVPADHFSARWSGQVQPQYSEAYTFYTNSDDGVRLWVNGQQIINNWTDHAPVENSATVALTAGQKYSIVMEYYENAGGAVAKLLWSSASQSKQVIPQTQLYPAISAPVANIAPSAVNDTATTNESTAVTINVLANDSDADKGPSTLSLASVAKPSNGTATTVSGQINYMPNAGFVGTDQFTYTVSDGAATATGTVSVTVNSTALATNLATFNLTGTDIGTSSTGSSRVLADNSWELNSASSGISGSSDSFHFESRAITGDFQIVARINSLTSTSTAARAGVMIRDGIAPGARYGALAATTGTNYRYASRISSGANPTETAAADTYTFPDAWLMIQRVGDTLTLTESSDDQTYRQAATVTLAGLPATINAGLFCTSGSAGINARTVVTNYQVIPLTASATPGSGTGLLGQYYDNSTGTSQLVLSRNDATVNFDWGTGSPAPAVPVDRFSVRWSGQVQPQFSETYTFYTTSDDGVRLWVNGQQIINNWTDHAPMENSGSITLAAGQKYDVAMEYYESSGGAVAKLLWSSPSQAKQVIPQTRLYAPAATAVGNGTGLKGDYFAGQTTLLLSRTDAVVNFDWGTGSPAPAVPADNFSVRWSGQVQPQFSETYTFYTTSDDGVRLWVNGQQIINNWTDHATMENSGSITLAAGQKYDIVMEYYENAGGAVAKLLWSSPSQAKQVIPQTQLYPAASTPSTATGLKGDYFADQTLTTLVLSRTDAAVNFNWGTGSPATSIPVDHFSVRWSGVVKPTVTGTYTFTTYSDDGVRLWINGQQLVNNWTDHAPTENSGTISLQAGQSYSIRMEFYENTEGAVSTLYWTPPGQTRQVVPQSALAPQ